MITDIVIDLVYVYYRVNQRRHYRRIRPRLAEFITPIFLAPRLRLDNKQWLSDYLK